MTTAQGKEPIGKLHVGEKVLAYNPETKQMEDQPILHVFLDHDNDLVDVTLTTIHRTQQGRGVSRQSEVIHTNKKHPFLTKEKGFLPVGQIKLGMHVLRADGTYGVVTGWKVVAGSMTMYNLEVAQDHTFTVGAGEWVVHNCDLTITGKKYSQDELDAANYVASIKNDPGDSVILRDPGSNRDPYTGDSSDLVVNGENYDIITPRTNNINRIIDAVSKKNDQAVGIVINLKYTSVTEEDLSNILNRVRGAVTKNGGTMNIQDVIFYNP